MKVHNKIKSKTINTSSVNSRCLNNLIAVYRKLKEKRKSEKKIKSWISTLTVPLVIEDCITHARNKVNKLYRDPALDTLNYTYDRDFSSYKKAIKVTEGESVDILNPDIKCICVDRFDTIVVSSADNLCSMCTLYDQSMTCLTNKIDHINFMLVIKENALSHSVLLLPHLFDFFKEAVNEVYPTELPERLATLIRSFSLQLVEKCPRITYVLLKILQCIQKCNLPDRNVKIYCNKTFSIQNHSFILDTNQVFIAVKGYWHLCTRTLAEIRQVIDYPNTEGIMLKYKDHGDCLVTLNLSGKASEASETLLEMKPKKGANINTKDFLHLDTNVSQPMVNNIS